MKKTYADSSFIASLYLEDANSEAAVSAMGQLKTPIWISPFVEVELVNTLQLRVFRKQIGLDETNALHESFRRDIRDGILVLKGVSSTVYETAMRLSRKHTHVLGVRTLDLIHIATAIVLEAERLCSFDLKQRALALAEGLEIIPKPTSHASTTGRRRPSPASSKA